MPDARCRIYARGEFTGSDLLYAELWRPYAAEWCYEFLNPREADLALVHLLGDRGVRLFDARCGFTGRAVRWFSDDRNVYQAQEFYTDWRKQVPPVTRVPPVGTICVAVHFCFDDLTCKQGPARTLPLVALDLIRSDMLDPNNKYAILDRRFAEMSPRTVEEAEAATVFSGAALYLLG